MLFLWTETVLFPPLILESVCPQYVSEDYSGPLQNTK